MMCRANLVAALICVAASAGALAAEPARPPANSEQRAADSQKEAAGKEQGQGGKNAPAAASSPSTVNRQPSTAGRRPTDRLELDTTVVTGNRELPKVLYIVPWKKADIGDLPAQPFNTLLDEALTPVDRDVFRREVTYYGAVAAGVNTPGATPASPAAGPEK